MSLSPYRSAWDNRNANVFAHLPDGTRKKYADFYDELANNNLMASREGEAWRALAPYAEPGPLGLEDRRRISSVLSSARSLNGTIDANVEFSRQIAKELGVRKIAPDRILEVIGKDLDTCAAAIAKAG